MMDPNIDQELTGLRHIVASQVMQIAEMWKEESFEAAVLKVHDALIGDETNVKKKFNADNEGILRMYRKTVAYLLTEMAQTALKTMDENGEFDMAKALELLQHGDLPEL